MVNSQVNHLVKLVQRALTDTQRHCGAVVLFGVTKNRPHDRTADRTVGWPQATACLNTADHCRPTQKKGKGSGFI